MSDRIIYYEVIRELPFAKIGDQGGFLNDGDIGINGVRMPVKYIDCDFFKPVKLKEHQEMIDKNFIKYIMTERNVTESEAIELQKDFWKLK